MDYICEDLQYKGLRIYQSKSAFRFGTDAVVLAGFANLKDGSRVADLGTGTGILPLLLSGAYPACTFDAFEIQQEMAQMAQASVQLNNLQQRITVHNVDCRTLSATGYDAVVCNPPYEKVGAGPMGKQNIELARRELTFTVEDAAACASRLLKSGGALYMVHRPQRIADIITALRRCRLEPKRFRTVHQNAASKPALILIEARRDGKAGAIWQPPLILCDDTGVYTAEAKQFYHITEG